MKQAAPPFRAASGIVPTRISAVVPHLNKPVLLDPCLRSLHQCVRRADEIVVVDNGSTVCLETVCRTYPGVRLSSKRGPGPRPARNKGIAESSVDILAFIDADCLVDPDWLIEAERRMSHPDAQILDGDVRISYADTARGV
jgi:glycosyltransferase involved in cell wall biosynthesis